jgi:hypothetical protein
LGGGFWEEVGSGREGGEGGDWVGCGGGWAAVVVAQAVDAEEAGLGGFLGWWGGGGGVVGEFWKGEPSGFQAAVYSVDNVVFPVTMVSYLWFADLQIHSIYSRLLFAKHCQ